MSFIQIKAGGPDIPEGSYPVVLTDILGPKTVLAQRGPNAGKEIELLDWIFAINAPGHPADQQQIETSSSTASGPKSKLYAFLTALFDGIPPTVGASYEKGQLIGRQCLAQIAKDPDGGWLRITGLVALPATMRGPAKAATPVAAAAAAAPDLPF